MDQHGTGAGGGLFKSYSSSDPSMNVPITGGSSAVMSPYLNFDPAYITPNQESQFILPDGNTGQRGRFELAFSQIGGAIVAGAGFGGVNGIMTGLRETSAAQLTGAVKRTQLLNSVTKAGASSAQTLGTIALIYSAFGVLISKLRGADDALNTMGAATATGLLYKSTAGLSKSLKAGGLGLALGLGFSLAFNRDQLKQMVGIKS